MGVTLGVSLSVALACSSTSSVGPQVPPEAAEGCNPIIGDDCLSPFPSSFYERADATSATGYRVNLQPGALPKQASGMPLSPDRLNQKDGFSPATPFIVYFQNGVDRTLLAGWQDPSGSLSPTSTVQIIDYETAEAVARRPTNQSRAEGVRGGEPSSSTKRDGPPRRRVERSLLRHRRDLIRAVAQTRARSMGLSVVWLAR